MKKCFSTVFLLGALALLALPACNNNTSLPSSPFASGNPTPTFTPAFYPTLTPTNTLATPFADTVMTETPNPALVHLSPTITLTATPTGTLTPTLTPTPSGLAPTPTPTPLSSTWTLYAVLGQPGSSSTYGANGYFGEPEGIAIGNGFIAVSDNAVTNIQVFNADGQYLYSITPTGSSPYLYGMAMDSNDELYVADAGDGVVQGFFLTASAATSATYDYSWSGQDTFTVPTGVKIDGQGNLVVCDAGNSAVYNVAWADDTLLATSTGNPGSSATTTYLPVDVALDAEGDPNVADYDAYNSPNGGRVVQYNSGYAYTDSISGSGWTMPLNNPVFSLIPDSQDNFFVSDPSNDRVVYMTTQGTYLGEIDGFESAAYLAVDAANDLFVVDYGAQQVLEYVQQ